MKILGLSFYYHDAAAALVIDGRPILMSEEERFSRKKHDSDYPELAVKFVLEKSGLTINDIDYVVFYEKPFIKLNRIMRMNLATFPIAPLAFAESIKHTFLKKLWVRQIIAKKSGVDPDKILFSEHHLSHAASAFYPSGFNRSAILTVDGVGEWAVTTIGKGDGNKIEILKEIHFPHSLGLLYSAFTAFLGFEVNEGEYKVMGMAPYGKPKYADKVRQLIRFFDDGSYELDLSYFAYHRSMTRSYSRKFENLFGKPRDPKSRFFTRDTGWPSYFGEKPMPEEYEKIALEQERYADIAASVQVVLEEAVTRLANAACKLAGSDKLCFAGGVALNSVANWKIIQNSAVKELFIQPAAGDAGGALGAALIAAHQVFDEDRAPEMKQAYFGAEYSDAEIEKFLAEKNVPYVRYPGEDELITLVAKAITDGKVIGWMQGRFEWGPRALGDRSILADPRRAEMKDIVNTKIKFREPYRPFAPSVLAPEADKFFDMPNALSHNPARFMLYVVQVRPEKQKDIPAITHVDGSARPQLVYKEESPRYFALINKFFEASGVPMLMNTSFNLKGEAIVNTPADAYSTFIRSGLDMLVMGNYVVLKSDIHE